MDVRLPPSPRRFQYFVISRGRSDREISLFVVTSFEWTTGLV